MRTLEEKIQFKNHFFKLGQGRIIPQNDTRFWAVFWTLPRDASDIFELLTPYDIQTVRDQNLPNLLIFVLALIAKLGEVALGGGAKKNHQEALNCVRLLAKILPFVFEHPTYASEIEDGFFLVAEFDPVAFSGASCTGTSASAPHSPTLPSSPKAEKAASGSTSETPLKHRPLRVHAASLVFSLVRLLFLDSFTLDSKAARVTGSALSLWEPGIGNATNYKAPDSLFDSHRSDILRLLLVLVSATFYERVPNVVTRGSIFMSLLVSAVPKQDFFNLVCSLTNLVCRSGRTNKGDLGLEQDIPSCAQLRLYCAMAALQLLASMLAYPIPGVPFTQFLTELNLIETEKPQNRVRLFFARLSRENDVIFLASHLLGILRSPMVPVETSGKLKTYRSAPSPMAPSALVMFWELMHCNGPFRKLIGGRFAIKLAPCVLYHMYAFYDMPQHAHSVKVAAYFLLYMSSKESIVRSLISTMPESMTDLFPPEFRLAGPISTRDFIIVHASQVLIALLTDPASLKTPAAIDMHDFLLPALVECLYNIIPHTNSEVSAVDTSSKGLANLNPSGGISYLACRSLNQLLLLFSSKEFLTKAPRNAELLALLLRSICAAAMKSPVASRMLLFSLVEDESTYNNIWNSVNGLDGHYFCVRTDKLLDLQEDSEEKPTNANSNTAPVPNLNMTPTPNSNGAKWPSVSTTDSADQASMNSDSSEDDAALTPLSPNVQACPGGTTEDSIDVLEDREIAESLRPKPPAGMSSTAKEKLPRDTSIALSWGGNDALQTILVFLIPVIKEKVGNSWVKTRGSVQDAFMIVKKIERANMADAIRKHRANLHCDFFPDSPIPVLSVPWSYLSLGWYMSMQAHDVYVGTDTIKSYMGTDKTIVGNISSSLAMFGKFATSWSSSNSSKLAPARHEAAIADYLDANFTFVNVWAHTSVKLFKIRKPGDEKGFQAFGMKFGSAGLTASVNDITHSLVKRFSDFRGPNRASVSSAGSIHSGIEDIPEGARLAKRDSVSSLHSLNALNRARTNTPRNSLSN